MSILNQSDLIKNLYQKSDNASSLFLCSVCHVCKLFIFITNGTRDIVIVAKEQPVPQNFTVFTAASGTQKANPLEEAKHGLFSYFLMKGMEGEADSNNDNVITAGELHAYVQQNVIQQSDGAQTPELQGDVNRVLVRFQ